MTAEAGEEFVRDGGEPWPARGLYVDLSRAVLLTCVFFESTSR